MNSNKKKIKRVLRYFIRGEDKNLFSRFLTNIWYHIQYYRAAKNMVDNSYMRKEISRKLISESYDKYCLQIGVRNKKLAPHWVSVDLFDHSDLIDYNYDVQDLKFENEKFDIIVCNAILEHVVNPIKAVQELYRVLKKGGLIFVEVPFNQPFHPSPNDYWRVTLPGLRIWMGDFAEISAGFFRINKSSIYNGIYFFGRKPNTL